MPRSGANINLRNLDDIFSTAEEREEAKLEKVWQIPLKDLYPFKDHPFQVRDDEEMQKVVDSVKEYGVVTPAIARRRPEGGYELISGHRRHHAAELAGLETMPVIVRNLDDDAAVILMVDANLQREQILPSEKAKAYKMKLEAIKHQGQRRDLTSGQVVQKFKTSGNNSGNSSSDSGSSDSGSSDSGSSDNSGSSDSASKATWTPVSTAQKKQQVVVSQAADTQAVEPAPVQNGSAAIVQSLQYQVRKGDTLMKIAGMYYGNTELWTRIYADNRAIIRNPDLIYPGQTIVINFTQAMLDSMAGTGKVATDVGNADLAQQDASTITEYIVLPGDYLRKIAAEVYGDESQWKKIFEANRDKIRKANLIYAGQKLTIPR